MICTSPSWVPLVGGEDPDSKPVYEYLTDQAAAISRPTSKAPFVDALSGKSYSIRDVATRVEWLARSIARYTGWLPNCGSPYDKVVAIHSLNTIDYFVICWAVHRLGGICLPIHSTTTAEEMVSHLDSAQCKTIFTCNQLAPICLEVAEKLSIPSERTYVMPLSEEYESQGANLTDKFMSIEQLIDEGSRLDSLEPLKWVKGQSKSQVAFLCPTSGTSGRQKLAMLTHYGMALNVMQLTAFENFTKKGHSEVASGVIPFSHCYGLFLGHMAVYRGDTLIVFPRFDMQLMLSCVPKYCIERLWLFPSFLSQVPPILAALADNPFLFEMFDLSTVRTIVTGAAPLSKSLAQRIETLQPMWKLLHAYGLTETCVIATITSQHDIWYGSSGSLLPRVELRLVRDDGQIVSGHDEQGEICFRAPNIFVGYLGNEVATQQTIDANGWMRTGDIGLMRTGPHGYEHLFVLDRIKDMIKVKGTQVLPLDIEALLVTHSAVVEAAVIGVPDGLAGERPQAYIVRSTSVMSDLDEDALRESIEDLVEGKLHETHWLHGRIEFLPSIPKSQNGKVLKKNLRAMATTA
ncbi:hypothetical protein ABKA04_004684 [Annulohypoxylon sp. FPYF3050]